MEEFDVVLVGTSPAQALLAAALTLQGQRVMHIDSETRYGSEQASLSLSEFARACESEEALDNKFDASRRIRFKHYGFNDSPEALELVQLAKKKQRRFVVDLSCRLVLSAGPLVDAIVRSKSTDYFGFAPVNRIFALEATELKTIPLSKADIFQSEFLSLQDKRLVMKFVHRFLQDKMAAMPSNADGKENKAQLFIEELEDSGLSKSVLDMLLFSVGDCLHDQKQAGEESHLVSSETARRNFGHIVESMGRYGSGCFLYPVYGSASISELLARKAAVFGGVYYLGAKVSRLVFNEDSSRMIGLDIDPDLQIRASSIVIEESLLPLEFSSETSETRLDHLVALASGPLAVKKESDRNSNCLVLIPPHNEAIGNAHGVRVIHVDCSSHTADEPFVTVYLSTIHSDTSTEELTRTLQVLCSKADVFPIWTGAFEQRITSHVNPKLPSGMFLIQGSSMSMSHIDAVTQAERVFKQLCPDRMFFPDDEYALQTASLGQPLDPDMGLLDSISDDDES
jgi:RAB protein geranylgeranyltransferase component A